MGSYGSATRDGNGARTRRDSESRVYLQRRSGRGNPGSPLFWNISWTLAATITLELKIRKPDGTLTDFTNPQAVVFTLPFPAPGQEFIPISAVEYTVTDSGSHAVVCRAGITAGALTLLPPTSYGVLVL